MKKTVTLLVTLLFVFNTFVARAYKYAPPYAQIDGGRAEENMPAPFSFESATKKLVAEDNFDSETANVHLERPSLSGQKSYDTGTIKFNKNQNDSPLETCLTYTGELYEGETYAFRCRIKTENLSGGAPRSIIQVYGKKGWIKEIMSTEPGQERKRLYCLTELGEEALRTEIARLKRMLSSVEGV